MGDDKDTDETRALLRNIQVELEKTNTLLARFFLPIFALIVILVVLQIVHR